MLMVKLVLPRRGRVPFFSPLPLSVPKASLLHENRLLLTLLLCPTPDCSPQGYGLGAGRGDPFGGGCTDDKSWCTGCPRPHSPQPQELRGCNRCLVSHLGSQAANAFYTAAFLLVPLDLARRGPGAQQEPGLFAPCLT